MMTTATAKPTLEQGIDHTRPHTLLTTDTKHSGSLLYQYDDTQETVTVPNIWYNQTYQTRVEAVRWDAMKQDEMALKFEKAPPHNITPAAAADIARRYRERARRIRTEADRMEAAGSATHPVAASKMQLDYGPNAQG